MFLLMMLIVFFYIGVRIGRYFIVERINVIMEVKRFYVFIESKFLND